MENYCRGCLTMYDDQTELLPYTEKIRRLFVYATGIQVKCNDAFTFQLCCECYANLRQTCKFKKQCRNSDRKYKSFVSLKDAGETFDFSMFLKNNDDSIAFRLPTSGNSTPAKYNNKDDDNESTCTSIRNFMKDILQGEEMPDTEVRIIKEVIEEEADIMDDSLDSHWLQDNVSIDTDFRLDFSFSPFSTPRTVNNDRCFSPKKAETQKEREKQNYLTSKQIIEKAAMIEKQLGFHDMPDLNDEPENITDNENIHLDNVQLNFNNVTMDFHKEKIISSNSFAVNKNILSEKLNEDSMPLLLNESTLDILGENENSFEILEQNDNALQLLGQITEFPIQMLGQNENNMQLLMQSESNVKKENDELLKDNGKSPQELHLNFYKTLDDNIKTNLQCPIDKNLHSALKDKNNKYFLVDKLIKTPPIYHGMSAASTPTINDILFGEKPDLSLDVKKMFEDDYDVIDGDNVIGQRIEEYSEVKGDKDMLKHLFNKDSNDVLKDLGKKGQDKDIFKVPSTAQYDLEKKICNICHKKFASIKSLKIHFKLSHKIKITEVTQIKNRVYPLRVCHNCGLIITNCNKKFERHIKKHENENNLFICDYCSYECKSKPKLEMHISSHTGRRLKKVPKTSQQLVCPICGAVSTGHGNHNVHMRRHTKEYRFPCKECGKGFHRQFDLNAHMRQHTGERPFQCPKCPKRFSRQDGLGRHLKVHLNERHFVCQYCNKGFVTSQHLREHVEKSKRCIRSRGQSMFSGEHNT